MSDLPELTMPAGSEPIQPAKPSGASMTVDDLRQMMIEQERAMAATYDSPPTEPPPEETPSAEGVSPTSSTQGAPAPADAITESSLAANLKPRTKAAS